MNEHSPYFGALHTLPARETGSITSEQQRGIAADAAREAAEREMAYLRALNTGGALRVSALELKQPKLADDFAQQVAQIDSAIYERGVGVDRDKLVEVGRKCFTQLLEADRLVRSEQTVVGTVCDLTSWASVENAFAIAGALQVTSIPERRMKEIAAGGGKDREAARQINGFDDLWETTSEPRTVRAVYRFRDLFENLLFARSMLERLDDDDRLHSRFFCGGSGRKVTLFEELLDVLKRPLMIVRTHNLTWHIVAWLAGEPAQAPVVRDLSRDFFSVRAPEPQQLRFMRAVLDAFCRGYDETWSLWQFVGRRTRSVTPSAHQLSELRQELARRFPRIAQFFVELKSGFYRSVGANVYDAHAQLDAAAYRAFIDASIRDLSNVTSAISALTIDEKVPVVARFADGSLLVEGKVPETLRDRIDSRLAAAFQTSNFEPTAISELQPA